MADCPLCRQPAGRQIKAQIAGWIRQRCQIPDEVQAVSHLCETCEHVFFTPFLSPSQLESLYNGYRDEEYDRERILIEPWYQAVAAAYKNPDSEHDRIRSAFLDFALGDHKHFDGLVIDYGGGEGHFARQALPSAEVTVVEEDYERKGFHLPSTLGRAGMLFSAQVFEHFPQPAVVLSSLVRFLKPGTTAWIEVPREYRGNLTAAYNEASQLDTFNVITTMHEHVAHFSRRSLKSLVLRSGLILQEIVVSDQGLLGAICHKA